jgi:2-phosphoglycerate kinase
VIILLNGSINAGKTTVAQELIASLPRTAHVEVDALREFVRFLPLPRPSR